MLRYMINSITDQTMYSQSQAVIVNTWFDLFTDSHSYYKLSKHVVTFTRMRKLFSQNGGQKHLSSLSRPRPLFCIFTEISLFA